jgi:hypothetical protein
LQDFIEGRHGELSIEGAVLRPQFRQTFPRAQSLEFCQSEIFGKPAAQSLTVDGLCALPCCKFGTLHQSIIFISFSCRATSTRRASSPSGSMKSAPSSMRGRMTPGCVGPLTAGASVSNQRILQAPVRSWALSLAQAAKLEAPVS